MRRPARRPQWVDFVGKDWDRERDPDRAIRQGDQSQVLRRMAYPDLPVTYT